MQIGTVRALLMTHACGRDVRVWIERTADGRELVTNEDDGWLHVCAVPAVA